MHYGPPRQFNGPPPIRGGRPGQDPRDLGRMPPHDPRFDYDPRRGGHRGVPHMRDQDRGHGGPGREGKDPRDRPQDTPDEYRPQRGAPRGRGRGRGRGNYNDPPIDHRMRDGDRDDDHRGEPNVRRRARGGAPDD